MIDQRAKRHGFSLVEILCVMALIAALGGIMAYLLKQTLDVERVQTQGFDQMLRSSALADLFRADVAGAAAAPTEWKDYKADARTLILKRQDGAYVVYRWQAKELRRLLFERDTKSERILPFDATRVEIEFVHVGSKSGIMRLRLTALRDGKAAPGQALEIAAALGGDWR